MTEPVRALALVPESGVMVTAGAFGAGLWELPSVPLPGGGQPEPSDEPQRAACARGQGGLRALRPRALLVSRPTPGREAAGSGVSAMVGCTSGASASPSRHVLLRLGMCGAHSQRHNINPGSRYRCGEGALSAACWPRQVARMRPLAS